MFVLRRAAFRAIVAKPSTTLLSKQRSIITAARPALVSRQQWLATSFQKRFAGDEAKPTESEEAVKAEASETAPEETATEATSEVTGQDAAATQFLESKRQFESDNEKRNVLYVGNLFFEVTEDALQRLFSEHGEIEKVKLIYDNRGLSKGFGYVSFKNTEDATKAIDALNQQPFQGRRLSVQAHEPRERLNDSPRRADRVNAPSDVLFIGNMSFDMSDKDLNDLFRDVKNVVDVRVAIDRRTGQPRGFAHADLLDVESAIKAKEILDQKEIHGRRLRVDFSQSTSERRNRELTRNNGPPRERRNYDNNGPPRRNYDNNGPPRERRNYDA